MMKRKYVYELPLQSQRYSERYTDENNDSNNKYVLFEIEYLYFQIYWDIVRGFWVKKYI